MTTQLPQSEVLARGEMVGEYRVIGRHAVGGMGAVYEATHPLIGKRVAVKVIHGRLSQNVHAVQRFVDEARAVNRIGHPNIVDIFAFGSLDDGRCYFVMEWLEGESLHERMMRGFLGLRETIDVLRQLTDALAAAHAAGVIHRDLKPANVHLTKRGATEAVKLLDFGIAKLSEHEGAAGAAMGTPEYISPEQAKGELVDASTDVYSLGALAYALFLGRLPFIGADARSVIDSQISQPVPNPIPLWPNIPPALGGLLLTMMSKEKVERPSLSAIRRELDNLEQARLLNETVPGGKLSKSKRPILIRNFDRFGALARAMMDDLSAGVAWVSPKGEAPAPGTPILIRHHLRYYGVAIDFPGLVEGKFSQDGGTRSLVRYDRVPKDGLGRVLSVSSALVETDPEGKEDAPSWAIGPTGERWSSEVPPYWAKRSQAKKPLPDRPTEVIPSRLDGRVPEPLESELLASADTIPAEKKPQLSRGFGLTAKVLLLTGLVTLGSVVAVMWLALVNVSNDRAYYFEDVSLRTSLYLAETVRARMANGAAAKEVIDAQKLPSYLTAWVVDGSGNVIAEVGPPRSRRALSLLDRSNPGTKQFEDEDGEGMIGAWSGGSDLAVVVAVPKSVSARAMERLRDQFAGAMAGVLVVAAVLAVLFARRLTRRLRLLTEQTAKIGRGEFTGVSIAEAQDEVGQLARSFLDMADALRERDEEVREIQRRMGQAEARAVQKQLAESLETQLAPMLDSMRGLLDRDLEEASPQEDFRQRQIRLRYLHERAASAVSRALALTSIVSRRVDFASAVSEAITFVRKKLGASAPHVKLFAANAVLFPRLDVGESELREIVSTLLERWVAEKGSSGVVEVRLSQRGSELVLSIKYPGSGRKLLAQALSEIEQLVLDASASAAVRDEEDRTRVLIAFAVDLEAEERA